MTRINFTHMHWNTVYTAFLTVDTNEYALKGALLYLCDLPGKKPRLHRWISFSKEHRLALGFFYAKVCREKNQSRYLREALEMALGMYDKPKKREKVLI